MKESALGLKCIPVGNIIEPKKLPNRYTEINANRINLEIGLKKPKNKIILILKIHNADPKNLRFFVEQEELVVIRVDKEPERIKNTTSLIIEVSEPYDILAKDNWIIPE